ncbi:MAG: hypothetical protein ACXVW3_01990 [Nocardioidaceae bacterium]
MTKRVVAIVVATALALALVGVVVWRLLGSPSAYEQATAWLPKSTLRASYTDWSRVRTMARGTALGPASSRAAVGRFLNRAFDRDLTTASAVSDSTYALMHRYGFSPLDAEWESYGQSRQGSVDVMRLDDSVDMEGIENALRTVGYTPPAAGAGTGGTWTGSADLVAQISDSLSPVQQNLVVLPDQHVVLMSDSAAYASSAANVVRGSAPGVTDVDGVPDLVSSAKDPVAAILWASDFACADLSMGDAAAEDQRVATDLVRKAGGINPLSGLVMALQPDRTLAVGMHFESSDEASANLQPRVNLASGAAPGQGGSFPQRFRITSATADGQEISMVLRPRPRETLLSDIGRGPVLFATC